jgi:hypothetical protein
LKPEVTKPGAIISLEFMGWYTGWKGLDEIRFRFWEAADY